MERGERGEGKKEERGEKATKERRGGEPRSRERRGRYDTHIDNDVRIGCNSFAISLITWSSAKKH